MTNVITDTGNYWAEPAGKARVCFVETDFAFGFVAAKGGGGERVGIWLKTGEELERTGNTRITGPYVPARKRVEGWVNVYPEIDAQGIPEMTFHVNKIHAEGMARENGADRAAVPVHEIDPAAEKEARELREKARNVDVWAAPELYESALSLLLDKDPT